MVDEITNNNRWNFFSSIAGILVPILYLSLLIIFGALEPGYSHFSDAMSKLGGVIGIRGLLFNLGLITVGILVIIFATGFRKTLPREKVSDIGFTLLILGAGGLIIAAIFHCTPGCTNVLIEPSLTGLLHSIGSLIAGMCLTISLFFFYIEQRKIDYWNKLSPTTIIIAIISTIFGIIFWITIMTVRLREIEGLIQRLGIILTFIWIGMMGYFMLVKKD